MLTIKDIYYLCQRNQSAHSESGEAVIIFYSRWGIEGYVTLPNGFLFEWGRKQKSANEGEITITFPKSFSAKPFITMAEENDMSRSAQYRGCHVIKSLGTSSMTIWYCDGTTYIDWIAIG